MSSARDWVPSAQEHVPGPARLAECGDGTFGLLEGMATARSIRSILMAASWAPSSNTQRWRFVVVRDAENRRQIAGVSRALVLRILPA